MTGRPAAIASRTLLLVVTLRNGNTQQSADPNRVGRAASET